MSPAVVYLIRHGPPRYPLGASGERLVYGPAAELTPEGELKCAALARAMRQREGAPLDVLVTSPYPRAAQTAAVLARELGTTRVLVDARLRDTESAWEGVPVEEFLAVFGSGRTFDDPRTRETIEALGLRMLSAYDEYVARFPEARVGFVSHGDPLRALYFRLRHPQRAYPPYHELAALLSLDTAQGLRLSRADGEPGDVTYVSAAQGAT